MSSTLHTAIFQYQCRDEPSLERLDRLDASISNCGDQLDLVICPELFLSGYNVGERIAGLAQRSSGDFSRAAAKLAAKHKTALIYGYPELADGCIYNSAICLSDRGDIIANHRKISLPNAFERSQFTVGGKYTHLAVNGWNIAVLVCYDVEFPEAVRACTTSGAELLVVPTALKKEWSFVADHMVPTRAFENGIFLAYANYCGSEGSFDYLGKSTFASPLGHIAAAGDSESLLRVRLDKSEIAAARSSLAYVEDRRFFDGCTT